MATTINGSSPSITFSDGSVQSTSARNGATVTSSAANITLTAASNQVQQITMTSAGLAVILPDATTYTSTSTGSSIFVISNLGANYFDIKNSSGFVVFGLSVGQTCTISLSGNTTQNQWVGSLTSNTVIDAARGTAATITTTAPSFAGNTTPQQFQVAALSSNLLLAVWLNSTTYYTYACAGTVSGSTITWGTPTAISVVRAYTEVNIAALSATTALIGSIDINTGSYYNGISISGTTITVSTISANAGSGDGDNYPLLPLTSTTAIYFYGASGSGVLGKVITYNGASAPTLGTAVNNPNSTGTHIYPVVLSPTSVLCFANNNVRVWSVSGTTLTLGAFITLNSTYFPSANGSLIKISATEAIYTEATNTPYVQKFTISGTTVTASTVWKYQGYDVLPRNSGANSLLSSTDFLGFNTVASYPVTGNLCTRYSYDTTNGVSVAGTAPFPILLNTYGICYVTTNTAAVVGLNSNQYPSGYMVYLT